MILIYTPKITNRIKYIFKLVFKEILNADFLITKNIEEFKDFDDVKINYSKASLNLDEVFFCANNLLFENGLREVSTETILFNGIENLFPVRIKAALPYDPFAASFYMVSRYEEYLPYIQDENGRFEAAQSIAFKKKFLQKPVVNIWVKQVLQCIQEKFPHFIPAPSQYKFIPTYDINCAYYFKHKGFIRNIGGFMKSILNKNFVEFKNRLAVILGNRTDPFDSYDFQIDLQKKYSLQPIYFILFANYGLNDKNIHPENHNFKSLIKYLSDFAEVGVHPSYNSVLTKHKLKQEIEKLSSVLNKDVVKCRQHFSKLDIPYVYRNYLENDLIEDYSMGYSDDIGFRAGICTPFFFYDLDFEMATNLKIYPFYIKDTTLKNKLKRTSINAVDIVKPLIQEVRNVNGIFISLWHNESLGNSSEWIGWKKTYEEIIKIAI